MNLILLPIFIFLHLLILMASGRQRPFYVIKPAHNRDTLMSAIAPGSNNSANGLITDVYFDKGGFPQTTTSNTITPDSSFHEYMRWVGITAAEGYKRGKKFILQIFVLKINDVSPGRTKYIAKNFANYLWQYILGKTKPQFTVIIIINEYADYFYIRELAFNTSGSKHQTRVGFGFKNYKPKFAGRDIHSSFNTTNIWQAGLSSHLDPRVPHEIIEQAVGYRNNEGIKKVIAGIVSLSRTIKELLYYNIDGIVTTDIDTLLDILEGREFKELYRFAKLEDDPFKAVPE